MSAPAAPIIPPRPLRTQQAAAAHGADKLPEIPPRPIPKRLDRSVSPANYPGSPLNEPFGLSRSRSIEPVAEESMPRRPSVQHLPSLGQEGMEYGEVQSQQVEEKPITLESGDTTQTRNVSEDLHLHAPKPSLPNATARAQVEAVTRTDSSQAASHGFGKPGTPLQDEHEPLRQVRSRASFSRPSSSISERRSSVVYGDEHGPAELGMRVPINPLLGDVQAPSPGPGLSPHHTGQNGDTKRKPNHFRRKSGMESCPPGSYGLHGHGVATQDPFEKDWYAKHPDLLQHEEGRGHGVYESIGSGRGSYALSSDDLNKIVHETASRGSGLGTTGNTSSYPDEQIGYLATDHISSRSQLPVLTLAKTLTNTSQPAIESPLRKSSFPADESVSPLVQKSARTKSDEAEGDSTAVHIDYPDRRFNKISGGEETINETTEPDADEQEAFLTEHGYSAPILASDEVAKEPIAEYLQPAISPRYERRGSLQDDRSGEATPNSRPTSRPGSLYGTHSASHSLSRFISHHDERDSLHTPLEDVEEYEPLFPDEDSKQKALSTTERFKQRPDTLRHRFPSKDIWEDTPSSAMYVATVSTPDLPSQTQTSKSADAEDKGYFAAKEPIADNSIQEQLVKSGLPAHLRDEVSGRPKLAQRFPSQDIWEDSPDSSRLVTTINTPPVDDAQTSTTKPVIPPRPTKGQVIEGAVANQAVPIIPIRPQKVTNVVPTNDAKIADSSIQQSTETKDLRQVPSIPDRPKPQVPARPAKKFSGDSITKTLSSTSAGSDDTEKGVAPPVKTKPQVPARPIGGKIAELKGSFMSDLNQKLGLGPPKEKEKEPEPELEKDVKPLEDARKGRARGPQRRAPAKSPSASSTQTTQFSMFHPKTLWHIDNSHGLLNVFKHEKTHTKPVLSDEKVEQIDHATVADTSVPMNDTTTSKHVLETEKKHDAPISVAPSLSTNTAGESTDPGSVLEEKEDLSKQSTASDITLSGNKLEREDPNPNTDAIPASKQTTATSDGHGESLMKVDSVVPEK